MKKIIIADSSALFSLFIETDRNYKRALAISKSFIQTSGSIVIPSEIFAELINIIGKKFNHRNAIITAHFILQAKAFILQQSTNQIIKSALTLFRRQSKSVSFTDCLVMAFADEFHTKEIFGFDETFRKNGYIRVGIDNR